MGIHTITDEQRSEHIALMRNELELSGSAVGFQRGFEQTRRSQVGWNQGLVRCMVHGTTMIEVHEADIKHPKGWIRTFDGKNWEEFDASETRGKLILQKM